jgi:hypothetical protein
MIFAIDPTMKRLVATIPRGDRIAEFDCVPDTCRNPACRCLTMTVTFRARTLDDPARPAPSSEPTVGVDLGTRMLDGKFRNSASPSDLAFAEDLLEAMEPADFDLLRHIHFMIKSRETELAKPTEIKAHFDFQEIERSSLMQTYNDILPFAETMSVVVDGIEYVILDQYCVRPGCRCKDVHLNLLPITEGRALETTGVVSVDYATKAWMRVEDEPLPCDVATKALSQISTASCRRDTTSSARSTPIAANAGVPPLRTSSSRSPRAATIPVPVALARSSRGAVWARPRVRRLFAAPRAASSFADRPQCNRAGGNVEGEAANGVR